MSILDDLHAERAKYGATLSHDECVALINAVAWKHRGDGWGLNSKTGGTHGTRYDGERVAHDILHDRTTDRIYDVLIAAGAESRPTWGDLGPNTQAPNQGRPWVAPIQPQGATEPVEPKPGEPEPEPKPQPGTDPVVVSMLLAISQELLTQRQLLDAVPGLLAAEREKVEAVVKDVGAKVEAVQWPVYKARILGASVTLTPEGR